MKAVIYTSTAIGDTGGVPKFNASAFPCHEDGTDTVFLNGHYPEIEALCLAENMTVLPFSQFKRPIKAKVKSDG